MKKYILISAISLVVMFFTASPISALSPTPSVKPTSAKSPTPSLSGQDSQIEKIKDLVASRVAELKLVDRRGVVGTVKNSTNTQITLTNEKRTALMVDIDELTKFEGENSKSSFGISDIKTGDVLSIIGLYNKQNERLLARFVSIAGNIPQNIEGVIVDKNKIDYTLTIATTDGKEKIINVESSTKTSLYDNESTIKSGFTKIQIGERIIVVGFADKTNKDQINASRIIHFPSLQLSNGLKKGVDDFKNKQEATPTPTPTKGK